MKSFFTTVWFVLFASALSAGAQTLTTLRDSGPRAHCINIVILAEGYTAAEEAKFATDAAAHLQVLIDNESWRQFADHINGFGVFAASAESGADVPSEGIVRNTYFDATFGSSGIDRLLTANATKVYAVLASTLPDFDVVIVLVNSTKYGGSGGTFAVTSLHGYSPDVILHELGHSFARLIDEYVESTSGVLPCAESPNATNQTIRANIPWRKFIAPSTLLPTLSGYKEIFVGLFEGINYYPTGAYRPTYTSKMRELNVPFGPVNLRAFANEMHRLNLNQSTVPPGITQQPLSAAVVAGYVHSLSVGVTGVGPITYQWLRDGLYLVGEISPTLTLAPMSASVVASYSVEITNATGSVESVAASITLADPSLTLTITQQPASLTLTTGQTASFSVVASNIVPSGYQWKKDGVIIPGATSRTYLIANATVGDSGSYAVVVSNIAGSVTSNSATLFVGTPPTISQQPVSLTLTTGQPASFSVIASNIVPSGYQWQKNGVTISGATSGTYLIANATASDAGNYAVVVSNFAGSVTSNSATLLVGTAPTGFDVVGYLTRYPAMSALYGSNFYAAWLHYRNHGIYDGEVFDDLFRVEEYLTLYPELAALFGSDLGGALMHWLNEGSIEGRLGRIPLEFSATGYLSRNPDVAAAVNNDPVLAWSHYWLYGIYEGRAYDEELRVFEYLAVNADLTAAFVNDWRAAALHWMRYGRTEGRLGRLPLLFNVTEYLTRSPDVAAAWGTHPTTVFLHYWSYGIDEGRTFDDEFRPAEYLALNADLAAVFGTDLRGAFKHWVRYGRSEGRPGKNP